MGAAAGRARRSAAAASSALCLVVVIFAVSATTRARPQRPAAAPSGGDAELVDITRFAPAEARIRLDLRYATADNFTHRAIYPHARCLLRRSIAERLVAVEKRLRARGYGLKLFDCYRPLSVQRLLWSLVPDERYVANPAKGSRHNRGAALDLTLVDAAGRELPMGTAFDDFTPRAHRGAPDLPEEVTRNRALLDEAMAAEGFTGLPTEWWHFDGPGWERYPILDVALDAVK